MMKNMLRGVLCLSLMVSLSGCGKSTPAVIRIPVTKTVIEKVKTPDELLRECARPSLADLETNEDLERILGEALVSLDTCSEDKRKIREWQEESVR